MNDPVDSVLAAREALDRGLPAALAISGIAHGAVAAALVGVALFAPRPPLLQVAPGFVVALPPGGGGTPVVEAAPVAAPPAPVPEPAAPPAPPPKVLKPVREQPKKGLPAPDARKKTRKEQPAAAAAAPSARPEARSGAAASRTPGLEFGPPGPGVPGGTDPAGDFYLASVQRKIWLVWTQQMRTDLRQPVGITFTIMADGSVADVRVLQSSGVPLLDLAAQRSVFSAAPFAPLPRHYGTNRYTIQALFKPTS